MQYWMCNENVSLIKLFYLFCNYIVYGFVCDTFYRFVFLQIILSLLFFTPHIDDCVITLVLRIRNISGVYGWSAKFCVWLIEGGAHDNNDNIIMLLDGYWGVKVLLNNEIKWMKIIMKYPSFDPTKPPWQSWNIVYKNTKYHYRELLAL